MSKYKGLARKVLSTSHYHSTNTVRKMMEKQRTDGKTSVNWHILHRALKDMERQGEVDMLKVDDVFAWKLKKIKKII